MYSTELFFLTTKTHKIYRWTLSFTSLTEIKSYSRHNFLQLRKLLQRAQKQMVCFAPLVMYSPGVNRLLKKVSSQKSLFPTPNSHRNVVPFSGNLGGGKRGRGNPAAACLLPRVQRLRRSVLGGASVPAAAAVQPPRVSTSPSAPWQPPSLLLYPKGELLRLGPQSLPGLRSAAPRLLGRAPSMAGSCPSLRPPQPPGLFWATVTGLGLPPCARGRGNKRKQPPG